MAQTVAADEASLRAADEEQRRLVAQNDADALAAMLHPNLIINGPLGLVATRAVLLDQIRIGGIGKEEFERMPEHVRITGNIGVLVGQETVIAAPGSIDHAERGAVKFQRRYTNVYLFQDGKWLMLARQASIFPPPAPRA